jgi:hypothetical protein
MVPRTTGGTRPRQAGSPAARVGIGGDPREACPPVPTAIVPRIQTSAPTAADDDDRCAEGNGKLRLDPHPLRVRCMTQRPLIRTMAEWPDPRKRRAIPAWDASRYPFLAPGEGPYSGPPETPIVDRSPGTEEDPRGSGKDPSTAEGPVEPRPERPPSQGLYDLPGLLARIWSVPLSRLTTSGSYATRPAAVPPSLPPGELDRQPPTIREPPPPGPAPWAYLPFGKDPSLPLAAVPSLTLVHAPPSPSGPTGPSSQAPRSPGLSFSPATHYIAWRRPPCRLAYELGRGRLAEPMWRADRVSVEVGPPSGTSDGFGFAREPLIRPASLPWSTPARARQVALAEH